MRYTIKHTIETDADTYMSKVLFDAELNRRMFLECLGFSVYRVLEERTEADGVIHRKQTQKSLTFPELKVFVAGNTAVARHIYLGESELDGKQSTTRIGALQVWQKQDGGWKLLARQGFKLA